MTPEERAVYDRYPLLMRSLVSELTRLAQLPVGQMLVANRTMSFQSNFVTVDNNMIPLSPKSLADEKELLELVYEFQDKLLTLMRSHLTK